MPLDSGSIDDVSSPADEGVEGAVCTSVCTPLEAHELEAAIASVTRALGATDDPDVAAELVAERRTLRLELLGVRDESAGAVEIAAIRRIQG